MIMRRIIGDISSERDTSASIACLPNENKISDGYRERAQIEMEVF
jgi:hypothetical protein